MHMPLITLSPLLLLITDSLAWLLLHLGISFGLRIETRRAELTHWLLMVPAPFFFLWNPAWAGWVMIVYALLANCPFIMIQRYNRPRLERVLRKKSALQVKQKATV